MRRTSPATANWVTVVRQRSRRPKAGDENRTSRTRASKGPGEEAVSPGLSGPPGAAEPVKRRYFCLWGGPTGSQPARKGEGCGCGAGRRVVRGARRYQAFNLSHARDQRGTMHMLIQLLAVAIPSSHIRRPPPPHAVLFVRRLCPRRQGGRHARRQEAGQADGPAGFKLRRPARPGLGLQVGRVQPGGQLRHIGLAERPRHGSQAARVGGVAPRRVRPRRRPRRQLGQRSCGCAIRPRRRMIPPRNGQPGLGVGENLLRECRGDDGQRGVTGWRLWGVARRRTPRPPTSTTPPRLLPRACTAWNDTPGVTTNRAMEFQVGGRAAEGSTPGSADPPSASG